MTKLIMDPSLFEVAENMPADDQLDHFMFLKDSIDFASDYFEASLDGYDVHHIVTIVKAINMCLQLPSP